MTTPDPWSAPGQNARDPYAAPETTPPAGGEPQPPGTTPASPVAPSGYEAQPYGSPQAPSPYAPQYGAPQAPQYGAAPTPQDAPAAQYGPPQGPAYGSPAYASPAYGSPAYGSPQYGSPQYGQYPQQGAYGPGVQWAQPQKTNGLAIASLIVSLASIFTLGFAGLVGLPLGIGALRQIGRSGDAGKGLAIAGVVVGALGSLAFILIVVLIAIGATNANFEGYSTTSNYGAAVSTALQAAAGAGR